MYKGTGIEKKVGLLVFIAVVTLGVTGCQPEPEGEGEVALEEGQEEEEQQEASPEDSSEREQLKVSDNEVKTLTAEPYEIKERWRLSKDQDYIVTKIPVAPGTVHQVSDFQAWREDYKEKVQELGESDQSLGVTVPLLAEAMSDSEDQRSTRLENHPGDDRWFISSIDFQEVSPERDHLLYRARMYEEEGKHEGPGGTAEWFVGNFQTAVEPKALNISDGGLVIEPFWSRDGDVIYYLLDEGLYSYNIEQGKEELIIPEKEVPGLRKDEDREARPELVYGTYRGKASTYIYYLYQEKIMKITLGEEGEVKTLYEGIETGELEKISVLQKDRLLLSSEGLSPRKTHTLLWDKEEIRIEKLQENSIFQDCFIDDDGKVFLLFTAPEGGAEVHVLDQGIKEKKVIELPSDFTHHTVLGKVPGEAGEVFVIGEGVYYKLK